MESIRMLEELCGHGAAEFGVTRCVNGARRCQNTYRAAAGVQHGRLGRTTLSSVKLREVTGGKEPEGLILIAHQLDVPHVQDRLIRDRVITAMAGVIEIEHAVAQEVLDLVLG